MSFYPYKLAIADKTTGVPITSYTNLNLRVSPYTVAAYTQLSQSGGVYEFGNVGTPMVAGDYKVFDDSTELTALGIIRIGEPEAVTLTGNNTLTGTNTITGDLLVPTGTPATNASVGAKSWVVGLTDTLTSAVTAVAASVTALTTYVNNYFYDKQAISTPQQVYSIPIFRNGGNVILSPNDSAAIVNYAKLQSYVTSTLAGITSGDVTAAQISDNLRFIMYGGTQETNRVYTTLSSGLTSTSGLVDSTHPMALVIHGMGDSDTNTASYNRLPETYSDDIHIVSTIPSTIELDDTGTYTATALGNKIIVGGKLVVNGVDESMTFENYIFEGCEFGTYPATSGTLTYNFTNCQFRNCTKSGNSVIVADATTTGTIFDITNLKEYKYGGVVINALDVITEDADVQPRYLLGRPVITASAQELVLSEGNLHRITGTTDIEWIKTTDLTGGTKITLEFTDSLDIIHNSLSSGVNAGIRLLGGVTLGVVSGDRVRFELNYDETYWYQY